MQRGVRLFGLPDPAPAFLVSEPPSRCSARCRPPTTFAVGSSSRALAFPPEFLELPPARPSRAPSVGLPPSSRHQPAESTNAGLPSPLRSVLGVSHAPDGFLLHRPCGFISPRSHVQGSLFRVSPSREAVRARRPPLPSCRSHRTPALSIIQWRQGPVPVSRALLRSRVRDDRRLFRPPTARYPPELLPSSGSPSRAAGTTFVAPSNHGLSRPSSRYWSSPIAADGRIFVASEDGKVVVLRAIKEWEILAVNNLEEETFATPAILDGRIYVRTRAALYCFGKR